MGSNGNFIKPIKFKGNNRFLVMARVADKSLHKEWLKPEEDRYFDLYLEYYGDGSNDYRDDCDFYSEAKDTKWPRLHEVFKEYKDEILKYDAVWIPDDDISTNCSTIKTLFETFMEYKLLLAQPALTKDSYYSHKITLRRSKYFLRYTQFVEVMVPIFSREGLEMCWESFGKSRSGWGLDSIWPKLLGHPEKKLAIIDQYPVKHTRKVGKGSLYKDIGCSPYEELDRICEEYGVELQFDYTQYGSIKNSEQM